MFCMDADVSEKVLKSQALYGRINLEIMLKPLRLDEAVLFFPKMSSEEKIKMSSGGGVKTYIDNLVMANFIAPVNNFAHKTKKDQKYKVMDEYLDAPVESALLCTGPISKKLVKVGYFDILTELKL